MTRTEVNYNKAWHGYLNAVRDGDTARKTAYAKLVAALWNQRKRLGEV